MSHFDVSAVRDGFCLTVPKERRVARPLHLLFRDAHSPHNKLIIEEGAEVTFIEEYTSNEKNQMTQSLTEITVHKNASVHFYKIQDEDLSTHHTANIKIHQEENSRVNFFTFSKGASKQRDVVSVHLKEKSAACHLVGFYVLKAESQEINHDLTIHHAAEYGLSSMLYKGIVDKQSKAAFRGKVTVHKDAQHIQTTQANHNLLLSKLAEVSSKPELEIYADNIKCTHGATVGELDAESLFYFRSRGIDQATATNILLDAFAEEVFGKIENPLIQQYIRERAGNHVEL